MLVHTSFSRTAKYYPGLYTLLSHQLFYIQNGRKKKKLAKIMMIEKEKERKMT